jgi:thiosulfate dehydrogenase
MSEPREPGPDVRLMLLSAGAGALFAGLLALAFALVTVPGSRTTAGGPGAAVSRSPVPPHQQIAQDASHPVGGQQAGARTFRRKDVATDPLPSNPQLAEAVRLGQQIFTQTPQHAARYVGNALSCTNCHIDGGQREGALPLVGIAAQFPAYSPRDGRLISLEDRIGSCFARSEAGTAPPYDSPELLAVAAYLAWLSEGQPEGTSPPWRGRNTIAQENLLPIKQLDPARGQTLYREQCAGCHGAEGQGGSGPPVWGPGSFSDGAGTGRVYTLAGFLRYAMPLTAPGSLSDAEAQHIAAFIDAQERPVYPRKEQDYPGGQAPVDAVYYPQRYPQNPLKR